MAISRSKRDIGLDLTRIIAFIQVPCIHFLFKIKYYNQAIIGERMYLMTFIRVMFMTCVPLFLLLTGYLSSEKKVEIAPKPLLKYYSRLVPILLTYVITAVIIIVYGIFRKRRDRDPRLRYPQCSRFPEIFVVHRNVHRACAHDPVSESSVERDRKPKRSALACRRSWLR